jgi:uncharacterized lipoprotein YbaY
LSAAWRGALGALVWFAMFAHPSIADSGDPPQEELISLTSQVPPLPPDGQPAPVQIPGEDSRQQPTTSASVTGTVTYEESVALPPNALVRVSLLDISRAGAPAAVLGELAIETGGRQVPIPFVIAYDPSAIDARRTYAVRARITVDGQLLFTSTTANLVITQGSPTDVGIVVQPV